MSYQQQPHPSPDSIPSTTRLSKLHKVEFPCFWMAVFVEGQMFSRQWLLVHQAYLSLEVWFAIGVAFILAAVFGVTMDRDGFVMGEGSGVLLLEELEHAKQRGANIYAEFLGGSFTCDAYHITEPHPEGTGIALCIEKALTESGVARENVNYVNAHATSTPTGDMKEYQALIRCFGDNPELRVNSTKSLIGLLLGAAGAVEAVAAVQVLVMTAQILLNILRHSIIRMEAIHLLILDECHHAVKKQPYSLVISRRIRIRNGELG